MYREIADYGVVGDMHSIALISKDGSVDYCAMPYIDSPTVFAKLLDEKKGGYFSIQPDQPYESSQVYLKDTPILQCNFTAPTAHAQLTDFMPLVSENLFNHENPHVIHRCLCMVSGSMDFILSFYPRPNYAIKEPHVQIDGTTLKVELDKEVFYLKMSLGKWYLQKNDNTGVIIKFSLQENQEAHFDFAYKKIEKDCSVGCAFEKTKEFWQEWAHTCVVGINPFLGEYTDMITRSLITLKLLTFKPTGAIAVAATTSLPEAIGGNRNWDYRYTWLRNASFTLKAMFALGHIHEAEAFVHWLDGVYKKYGAKELQIMYSVHGEKNLEEKVLSHLSGYKQSAPVRVGNRAYSQNQWDVYGEIMDTALRLSDYVGEIDDAIWPFLQDVCNLAAENWKEPDEGIWEVRNGLFHFVYSKVMCWVALDRGIKIAERYGFEAPLDEWQQVKNEIFEEVIAKGYNIHKKTFVQHYDTHYVDASLLLLPLMGFLPIDDERIQGTIEACKRELLKQGYMKRYINEDGLSHDEGAFILCNFWLIECLALSKNMDEAKDLLEKTVHTTNHLGLFSEEYDIKSGTLLGNFPQAFSHIGYINAVNAILKSENKMQDQKISQPLASRFMKLLPEKTILNKGKVSDAIEGQDIAKRLKKALNHLQGSFFDVQEGRVDYCAMRESESFEKYVSFTRLLQTFDPYTIASDDERKAFWINIYNILIIHGVVHFDIQKSVQEVVNFFQRIGYIVGGQFLTADDIEHGILRGNRSHPAYKLRSFKWFDARKQLCVRRFDPRIHFALVCASSSCPPIEFYDAQKIDHQLKVATSSFIRRKGVVIDKDLKTLSLSQLFKWYQRDFGRNPQDVMKYLLQYIESQERGFLEKNLATMNIQYLPYNWNLNEAIKQTEITHS